MAAGKKREERCRLRSFEKQEGVPGSENSTRPQPGATKGYKSVWQKGGRGTGRTRPTREQCQGFPNLGPELEKKGCEQRRELNKYCSYTFGPGGVPDAMSSGGRGGEKKKNKATAQMKGK